MIQETGEACDDGNSVNFDGCSATCTVEAGFTCNSLGLYDKCFKACGTANNH